MMMVMSNVNCSGKVLPEKTPSNFKYYIPSNANRNVTRAFHKTVKDQKTLANQMKRSFASISNNLSFKMSFLTLSLTTSLHSVVVSILDYQYRRFQIQSRARKYFSSKMFNRKYNRIQEVWTRNNLQKNRLKSITRWINSLSIILSRFFSGFRE